MNQIESRIQNVLMFFTQRSLNCVTNHRVHKVSLDIDQEHYQNSVQIIAQQIFPSTHELLQKYERVGYRKIQTLTVYRNS